MNPISNPNKRPWLLAASGLLLALVLILVFDPAMAQENTQPARVVTPRPQLFVPTFYVRLLIDLVTVFVLVMFVYLPIHRKKDYFFMFLVLNFLVFIITFLLSKSSAFGSLGMGFGLMAFFGLLRLRTDTIAMKDITYLFIVLTIALVNSSLSAPDLELIALNVAIVLFTYGLDKDWLSKSIHSREITLDNLEHVVPEANDKLIESLRSRTGLEIQRVKVKSVDLVKQRAVLDIYYY